MARKIVIGIHGLLNKPPKQTLETWWAAALAEGLRNNLDRNTPPAFELAYWADVRHPLPVALSELEEAYEPLPSPGPLTRYDASTMDKARAFLDKWGGRVIDRAKDLVGLGPAERLLGISLADLGEYYSDGGVRARIRSRLSNLLLQYRDDSILLAAHSMGSIVAHDVLRELETTSPISIDHWITIGSPLGLPLVSKKIRDEFGDTRTPTNVRRWSNLADPRDRVALDCNLADEYAASPEGVHVEDVCIVNGYHNAAGAANNHKSYGYLRAPEMSERIGAFLEA